MLVGPAKALFMDEISTGLDSSTTFQIVNSLRQSIHILSGTAVISLLQPAPETYDLFDDIILLSDGQIVYQGPRENVLEFFEYMGFKCPERKGVADFLQEVIHILTHNILLVPQFIFQKRLGFFLLLLLLFFYIKYCDR
jgi:ABC-type multidrug transport system ATPase subunit